MGNNWLYQKLVELAENFSVEILEEVFKHKFKDSSFKVIKERLYDYEDESEDNKVFEEVQELYEVELRDNNFLKVYVIKTGGELSERSSKRRQFDLAKRILSSEVGLDAGLFAFYDDNGNFRLSLVYKIYRVGKTEFSHYKRYTYFVEKGKPYRTFLKAFYEGDFSSLNGIISTFSTQPLTKEFFTEIQNWYAWALKHVWSKHVWFPGGIPEENLIRLLTRLIFVWFLKEKKLIPDSIFDEEFLKKVVKKFNEGDYYYNVILQNLFFATLNRYPDERGFAYHKNLAQNKDNFGTKTLYRYEDKILISEKEFLDIFKDIPFVNGGLFECLDEDSNYIDGFSKHEDRRAKIPDFLFFSDEREEDLSDFYGEKKKAKVRGLIKILKDYNWTADESSPIDIEVSLDPELLGHIFENLLAVYNQETQTTARKATGSYYTPKEIVDFMVEQSLFEYLKTKTNIDEDKLKAVISYEEKQLDLSEDEKKQLIEAIDSLKIIDPAVGSGAFPMGVLHRLVHVLGKIDPDNNLWYELQHKKALQEFEKVLEKSDKDREEREKLLKEIVENFDEARNYPDYARKLYLIENSIYGVDIQNIAVQICKLRFFLSLVIDQKVDRKLPNFGIKPLPHLETKFVCANTLIGLEKPKQLSLSDSALKNLKEELKEVYKRFFRVKSRQEKKRLEERANKIRQEIKTTLKKLAFPNETIEKITNFNIFSQTEKADWFDPEWMFGVEDGFDIVIGNPPYISTKGVDEKLKPILEKYYGFADDFYNHFFFKGLEILKDNGILAYISSKTYWTIQTKKNLRDLLLNNTILTIFDTANPFENAMVDTSVIIVKKSPPSPFHQIIFLDGKESIQQPKRYTIHQEDYKNAPNKVIFIPTDLNKKIYQKLGKKVNELLNQWWKFINTSKNIKKYEKILEEYRNSLKPGDITLLGLITEGGQGLATGNNGKYIGVLEGTKWAEKVYKERPEKLLKAEEFCRKNGIKNKKDAEAFLNKLDEKKIRKLFDDLKEKYGRDIFGQGWLYRIVSKEEIADVDSLTEDEKLNGIKGTRTFVPYDKGDKEGNRWYAPTPYYIDWSRENVKILQTDPKARWQGYQFYFREGFCWNLIGMNTLKVKLKEKTINDVASMSLYPLNDRYLKYLIVILNSKILSHYQFQFVNTSVNLQMNDIRQLPIIIPTSDQLKTFENICDRAISIQKRKFAGELTESEAEEKLEEIQKELDELVLELYGIKV